MNSEKDYAVQFVAREQAELRVVERDSTPLAPDEIAGRSIVTLISAGTESTGSYPSEGNFPRGSGYAAVYRPREVEFLELNEDRGLVRQAVRLVGPDGSTVIAVYTMERQLDGVWKIAGVYLVQTQDENA